MDYNLTLTFKGVGRGRHGGILLWQMLASAGALPFKKGGGGGTSPRFRV